MYDKLMLLEVLKQTFEAAQKVIKRFEPVVLLTGVSKFSNDGNRGRQAIWVLL